MKSADTTVLASPAESTPCGAFSNPLLWYVADAAMHGWGYGHGYDSGDGYSGGYGGGYGDGDSYGNGKGNCYGGGGSDGYGAGYGYSNLVLGRARFF